MNAKTLLAVIAAALCYFVMSSMVSQIGVTSAPMAQHFNMKITEIVPLFSFLTGGAFAGVFISIFVFNYISVRHVRLLCSSLLIMAAGSNYLLDSIVFVPIGFAIMGVAGGVGRSAAAVSSNTCSSSAAHASWPRWGPLRKAWSNAVASCPWSRHSAPVKTAYVAA